VDVAAVIGGDNGFNRQMLQADIHAIADLRAKTVIVDVPDTAYAFQLHAILERSGLNKGDHNIEPVGATSNRIIGIQQNKDDKASMLNLPFAVTAENDGLEDEGSAVSMIGPCQATAGIVLRSWAKEHPDTLVRYLQAYIEGLRYALDPKNRDEAMKMLADGLKLSPDVAAATYAVAPDPVEGPAKDGSFSAGEHRGAS
jgi:ABC-type nitrate/sulfonate/bicarbonate transport system substrate-binding protein